MVQSFVGHLLLSMPRLKGEPFANSVVLICQHDAEGSMGLILNKPQKIAVLDVLQDLKLIESDGAMAAQSCEALQGVASYSGGPVDPFRGFVLHDSWNIYESTMKVSDEVHLTSSRDVLEEIGRGEGPQHYRLILGYAGWGAGQLEQELAENAWLVIPSSPSLVFYADPRFQWQLTAQSLGIEKMHLSSEVGHS
ncbi:MAG: YqgE/AlgH family protein [Zetaproteobacteria bacterium]|nr:YqgE/AlgH family protein [Zetaproteobacteria bacterium]